MHTRANTEDPLAGLLDRNGSSSVTASALIETAGTPAHRASTERNGNQSAPPGGVRRSRDGTERYSDPARRQDYWTESNQLRALISAAAESFARVVRETLRGRRRSSTLESGREGEEGGYGLPPRPY
jgi:hypothetical protein